MPKRAPRLAMPANLRLDGASPVPLHRQLYRRLQEGILSGQIPAGARVPSTRALASQLGVSRTTTAAAYDELAMEGYLESRVGDGTRVTTLLPPPDSPGRNLPAPVSREAQPEALTPAAGFNRQGLGGYAPFLVGYPDTEVFPFALWAGLLARQAKKVLPGHVLDQDRGGYPPLSAAIAAHIGMTRGVRCTPDQVLITAGAQGALDLAARVLLPPRGGVAWVENPGYFGAWAALRAAGARLVPLPVDQEGMVVGGGDFPAATPRIISVTPSHQFPTGATMSLRRRLEVLDVARQAGAWILEDDYDSEYRFSGRPLEALQAFDSGRGEGRGGRTGGGGGGEGRVIYVGTFSKTLFPALRLGYLVVPGQLVEAFLARRCWIDGQPPILEQLALTEFITGGHFGRYLRLMRRRYVVRRRALLQALADELADVLEVPAPQAGIHLVAWLPRGWDDRRVAGRARSSGLEITPLSRYSLSPLERGGLVLGFARAGAEELRQGVEHLARVLRS